MDRSSRPVFEDGRREIYFVLVYKVSQLNEERFSKLENYLGNLVKIGVEIEVESFTADADIKFVKIHVNDNFVIRFASLCDLDLAYQNPYYRPPSDVPPRCMRTPITNPDRGDEIYQRAPPEEVLHQDENLVEYKRVCLPDRYPVTTFLTNMNCYLTNREKERNIGESVSGEIPKNLTSAEKIIVLERLMTRIKYGDKRSQYGFRKLIQEKVFLDAFPVHDGPYYWAESGKLNDRQLLSKFWGSFRQWYKAQPLHLIERYFGTEYGFYFALHGHYVKMLVPMGILSFLCILYGLVTFKTSLNSRSIEICSSDVKLCPRCHFEICKTLTLSNLCFRSYIAYVLDNPVTILLAVAVSLWSTVFVEFWKRKEAMLQLQWNVKSVEIQEYLRPEYIVKPRDQKNSTWFQIGRCAVSIVFFLLLIAVMVLATIAVVTYRLSISYFMVQDVSYQRARAYIPWIASTSASIITAIVMIILKPIIYKVSMFLTNYENHRTQYAFDNSYIYKCYALEFANSYTVFFYITFFKGHFFTHPGEMKQYSYLAGIDADACGPLGCITELSIQLVTIFIVKAIISNISQLLKPFLFKKSRRIMTSIGSEDMQPHEYEYLMQKTDRYFLVKEYIDIIIHYGYVVFFVAGFPPAPIFALLNNIFELRTDALKITKIYRRPVPNKVAGLRAWFTILQTVTWLGVVTNGAVIAFTSDFVPRHIYRKRANNSLGYMGSSLSEFSMDDFKVSARRQSPSSNVCYYPGMRYPPDHPHKYERTVDYWYLVCLRFITVMVFEHLVFLLDGILAFAIPDIPRRVTELLKIEERKNKDLRMKTQKQSRPKEMV